MTKRRSDKISIVLATYTGASRLPQCLSSILNQNTTTKLELIVVIDGPSNEIKKIVSSYKPELTKKGINLTIHQFSTNQGRFVARLKGARLARYPRLIIIDDKIALFNNYVETASKLNQYNVVLPINIEAESKSLISRVVLLARTKLYRQGFNDNFKSYEVTADNFEATAKGTGGLIIDRQLFIKACESIVEHETNLKATNEDTKILRQIVDWGKSVYKCSEAKAYYRPHVGIRAEIKHLYARGPRFVNYYIQSGTRFNLALWGFIVVTAATVAMVIIYPSWLLYVLAIAAVFILLAATYLAQDLTDFFIAIIAMPLILLAFGAGVIKGLLIHLTSRSAH